LITYLQKNSKVVREMKKILFIATHPDDETLGCGGTILKHKKNGDEIYWLIITNISENYGYTKDCVNKREIEINQVAEKFEFNEVFNLNLPTTQLDEIPISQIISKISSVIKQIEPNTIYLNNRSDIHTDHQTVFQSVMSCTKNFRYPFIKRILMYETLSETEFAPALPENCFIPNVFIDISDYFDKKIEIMKLYESEVMLSPMPRSVGTIQNLAALRGSRIGVEYAESFMLLQEIL